MNLLKMSKQIIVRHLHGNENLAKYEMKFYSISTRLPLIIYIKMI